MQELFKEQTFTKTIEIDANCSRVWAALTDPKLMRTWMSESDIDIITDWEIRGSLKIQGYLSGEYFENNGLVLSFKPYRELSYSHLSSLSGLTDRIENYSVLVFYLTPVADQTQLTLTISNFPTEDVYEEGGILDLLENLKPTFEKLNFKCDITDYFVDWDFDNKWLNQGLTMNGTPYIIFKNFPHMGWGESPKRIAEILNAELANQNKEERIYLVSGGNDGRLIFLTKELYQYIYSVYLNTEWKPLELQEWAKIMGVKPMTFL